MWFLQLIIPPSKTFRVTIFKLRVHCDQCYLHLFHVISQCFVCLQCFQLSLDCSLNGCCAGLRNVLLDVSGPKSKTKSFFDICFMPAALSTSANGSNPVSSTSSQLSVTEQDSINAIMTKVSWPLDWDWGTPWGPHSELIHCGCMSVSGNVDIMGLFLMISSFFSIQKLYRDL